jgi:serine/threonine protein kinase/tetratricopeptide (TPR) repeat protein
MTIEEIFLAAVERAPDERVAYLDVACAADAGLRAQVEALLRSHVQAGSVLEQPLFRTAPGGDDLPAGDAGGQVIEGYKLLERMGEGGMGSVWMAQQTEPVKRLVAVKLIKAGLDSKQVIARFEAERQALALMDHPNIARVLDAGTTSAGRPYFVMDLVKGVAMTQYCDEHRLTPRQRLELFVPVCRAVQHAHQKGVIHRDLKPPNVLVALYDGQPVPKVIDFGVAKATGLPLTDKTLVTGFGAIVGTLEYMAPEQAEVNQLDVDTRSDIYSLGILLYELLTGGPPFTRMGVGAGGWLETLRLIREQEPTRPSTKLATADGLPALAANRGTEPAKLTRMMRGELDWIVMKALEKDRNRRYETADTFAADVQRYLNDDPVLACPPSNAYRLSKFVRRNMGVVLAGAAIALLLTGGVVGTAVGLVRAEQRAEGERQAKDTAEKRLAQIEKGIDVLGLVFDDLDPLAEEKEGRPLRAILGDRLDQAAAALDGEAVGDPLVVAKLQERLGQTYLGLGHGPKAEVLFTKAVATRQAHLGEEAPLTLTSRHNQALAFEAGGKRIESLKQFEQVYSARVRVLGADHPDTLGTLQELAVCHHRAGNPTQAIPLLERVRDGRVKQLGEDHDLTLATLQALAATYSAARKHPEAIDLAERVLEAQVRKHGDAHPRAVDALVQLAQAYQAGYKMSQALALFEQAEFSLVPKLGDHHPHSLRILHGLGVMYRTYRKTPRAIGVLEKVRERRTMVQGTHHPSTITTQAELALAYLDAKQPDRALSLFREAAVGVEKIEFAHDYSARIVHNLARCLEQSEQHEEAADWRQKWVRVARVKYGPDSLLYARDDGLMGLGTNLLKQQKYIEAEPVLRESLTVLQNKKPNDFETFQTESRLGGTLLGQKKYADAERHLVDGYQGMKEREKGRGTKTYGPPPAQEMAEALERLVQFYDASNRPTEAGKWRNELEVRRKAAEQPMPPTDK